jgi:hypothetical protein
MALLLSVRRITYAAGTDKVVLGNAALPTIGMPFPAFQAVVK